jgi:cytochrome b561
LIVTVANTIKTFPASPDLRSYDRRTIVLHWATAILVAALWLSAQVIDWFPAGARRTNMTSVHILLGVILAGVLVHRMVWRRLAGAHLPPIGHPIFTRIANVVHLVLYLLLVGEILLGLTNTWVRGQSIFNLFAIPSFAPGDRALRRQINGYHELIANTILIIAGLHALAALVHHYVWKDDVLRRMLPGRRSEGTPGLRT